MKRTGGLAVSAIVSSLLTLACCLPLGFVGAAGVATLAVVFASLRPWLLVLSALFLVAGSVQAYRGNRCGVKPSRANLILLGIAFVILLMVVAFPQLVAGWLADLSGTGGK